MKLHLPISLRRSLLLAFITILPAVSSTLYAGVMHPDVSLLTYTDFGQNRGRYAAGPTNALLSHIRQQEGGVTISYTGGQPTYTMPHGMMDFASQCDGGYGAAIGYNWYATVEHNGVHNNTYAGNFIGTANAVHYVGIEYRYSQNNTFRHTPNYDYKITRQSKLITDVTGSTVYGSVTGDYSGIYDKKLVGQLLYRAGSGRQGVFSHDGNTTSLTAGYVYITGAIASITTIGGRNDFNGYSFFTVINPAPEGVNASNPLPYVGRSGDSGSPVWVWNDDTQQFEYLSAVQSGSAVLTNTRGASEWTNETMESYNVTIDMPTDSAIHLKGIYRDGETLSDSTNNVSTTLHYGKLTDDRGNDLVNSEGQVIEYRGIQAGIHTWKDLSGIKDQNNWYAYGASSLNATPNGQGADLSYADLFHNDNLVFAAQSSQEQHISVDTDVDLGIGYVQLSKAEGVESASFTISSAQQETGADYLLNSAGYVVDGGVSLHLQLTNSADYMREWRKIGDGNLFIEGSGDNNILLNLGGNGTTYLQRENGYSAYNVLANNGTKVVISDIGQIRRDFTFGFRGGVLDMNGLSMAWNNSNAADAEGFTIHALDEHAIISNSTGESTLTWTQGGQQTWLGSFVDTATGSLRFIYDGGANSVLTMHSIHTNLSNHEGSRIEVASGKVQLVGTNTIHGMGSQTGTNANRYFNEHDWHYADVTADITVRNGGVFELGSHARLTGDITVESGGTLIMHEGVQQQYEHLEGGQTAEDTYQYRDFYGLKGNIDTGDGATVRFQYSEGTTSTNVYSGNITGAGNVEVDLGTHGGTLILEGSGSNYSGEKRLTSGILIAADNNALGAVGGEGYGKWNISETGVLASRGFVDSMASSDIMAYIDPASTGVLALTADRTEQLDAAGQYRNLYIGALSGQSIHYGSAEPGQTQDLAAYLYGENETHSGSSTGYWHLGGGGGNLIVNFRLTGANDLILGNAHGKGEVTLTNTANDFTGSIIFNGAITLNYDDVRVLGQAVIKLDYSTRVPGETKIDNLDTQAQGILLLTEAASSKAFDLTHHTMGSIGSDENLTYTGSITLAENAAYHFGGGSGTLTIASELESGHNLVIDAQTYNNGTIIINDLADISGSVSISGYVESKTELREGDVTLKLLHTQTDVFSNNAVTLSNGGILDIAGTQQTFTDLTTGENSFLVDSPAEAAGAIRLTPADGKTMTLAGSFEVADITLAGSNTSTIELGGTNIYNNLRMESGAVRLISDGAFSGDAAWLSKSATLNLNGHTVAGKVFLADGAVVEASAAGSGVASGGAIFAEEGASSIRTAGTTAKPFTVSGSIGATAGATLELTGSAFAITGGSINSYGGTLSFAESANIRLSTGNQFFGGTFRVAEGTTLHNGGGSASYSFNTLHIDGSNGRAVTLSPGGGGNWNSTTTAITHLDGAGTFIWDSWGYTWNNSRTGLLTFNGEGNFDGVVRFVASNNGYNGPIARFVELTHDKALQNAGLELVGRAANRGVALAVNTGNAHVKGLTGTNVGAYIYAGAAGGSAASVPASSRQASITLNGDGAYEFLGSVGINDSGTTNGISLIKAGSGTQAFKGATVIINNVEVQKGTLHLEASNTLNVRGNISVTRGATLLFNNTLTLNAGKTLSILAGDEPQTGSAQLSAPGLTLAGGDLSFSARTFINESTASLQGLGTVQAAEGIDSLVVNIIDTSALSSGRFFLADGDWSAASGLTFTTTGLDYLTATYTADSSGLYIDLSAMDGHFIWDGDETHRSWSSSLYGTKTYAPSSTDTAIFNNVASGKEVTLDSPINVAAILFDNSANNSYTLAASSTQNTITTGNVTQRGNGTTEINAELTTSALTVESGVLKLVQNVAATTVSIQNSGTLEVAGAMTGVTSLSMGGNATLRFTGSTPGSLSDISSLVLVSGGTMTLGQANIGVNSAAHRYFTANTTLALDGSILDDRLSSWRLANSTFSLTGSGTLYVNGIRLSDQQSSTISTLNIGSGSTLVITGSEVGIDGDFALSHWPTPANGTNVVNIEGTLTANAQISAWDSAANINIRNGGVLNLLQGLTRNTQRDKAVSISVDSGSRLNATGGTGSGNLSITLQPGSTLGAIGSEATFTNAFSLGNATQEGAVTIDTTYSTVKNDGSFAVQQSNEGGIINLTGNIGSYAATSLAIAGKGTVNSSGALAVGKDLLVQDTSTLHVTGAIAVQGNIRVTEGAGLLLDSASLAGDLTLSSGTLSISGETHLNGYSFNNSGTISLADSTIFDLSLSDFVNNPDGTYTYVFSRGNGTLSHSDSLTLSDIFVINGSSLTEMGEGQYTISRDNGLAITLSIKEVSWAGQDGHTWETENAAWYLKDTARVSTFHNMDSVTFGADGQLKTVSLESDKTVNHMQVEDEGYAFDGAAHTISVASNLVLTSAASGTAFNVGLAIKGNMDVAGQATFSQAVSIGGKLTVSGTALFSTLPVTTNPITVTGTLGMAATADAALTYGIDAADGTLSIDTQGHALTYNAGSLRAGSLRLTGGGSLATNLNNLNLPNIELGAGTALRITNAGSTDGANKSFGNLSMGNNSVLAIHDVSVPTAFTTIGKITLDGGTATITDTHHSGYNRINALSGTGTLQFHKAAKSQNGSVYELGSADVDGGDFAGDIILRSVVTDNGRRSATIVISNGNIARNAVITLDSTNSAQSTAVLGLGIHADTVTLAGLASNKTTGSRAIVYSGTLGYNSPLNTDDTCNSFSIGDTQTLRTLVLSTANNAAYTYYGRFLSNLNIVKDGAGTQTFAGTSADFNGSISIQGGTLAFNTASVGMLATTGGVTVGNGAMLDLSAIAFDESGTNAISLTANSSVRFAEGSTLNLAQLEDGAYRIFQPGEATAFEGWQSLSITMSSGDLTRRIMNLETDGLLVLSTDNILWRGDVGASWAADDRNIWLLQSNGTETSFRNNDRVIFDSDTAASRNVIAADGGVTAETMTVTGEGYTFSGGTIHVADSLTISSTGSATFAPGHLSVGGTLAVEGSLTFDIDSDTALSYDLDASNGGTVIFDTTSAITYNNGTLKAHTLKLTGGSLSTGLDVNLSSVVLGNNATLLLQSTQADSGQNKTIGTVSMGEGSVLAFKHDQAPDAPVTIGGIALNGGTATVKDINGSNSAYVRIETLTGSGTLHLTKDAVSSYCTVYDLGSATSSGGTDASDKFSGIISVSSNTAGSNRPTVLTISNGDIASRATIHLGTAKAGATYLGLGIHADHTTIAGLTSDESTGDKAILYSGSISGAKVEFNDSHLPTENAIRTLTIDTAVGADHTFNGRVLASLDNGQMAGGLRLEKTGEGSQTFTETATLASVNVQGGTLTFTGSLTVGDTITVGDHGKLTIGGSLTFASPIESTGTITLQTGANIALSLSDFTQGSYTVISGGNVVTDGSDFASLFSIDGSSLANMSNSQYSFVTANGGLTLTIKGFWAGTKEQYTWDATQFGPGTNVPGSKDTAFFTDEAENKNVLLAASVNVHHAEFDSSQAYQLTADGSCYLAADKISQLGTGETTIDADVYATDIVVEQGSLSLGKYANITNSLTAADGTHLSVKQATIASLSLGQNVTISSAGDEPASVHAGSFVFPLGSALNIDRTRLTVATAVGHRSITSTTQTINLTNDAAFDDRQSYYRVSLGKLNIDGGGTMYIKGFCLNSDANNSSQDDASSTRLSVKNGSSLIVTGSAYGQEGDFALSSWKGYTYMDIDGTVTSNAILSSWDSDATVHVQEGGTINLLKGLSRNTDYGNRTFNIGLTVATGARLNAAGGTQDARLTTTLQAGSTLGAIDEDVTFTNNFTLSGNGTVTIDTNYSTADADFIVTRGTEGGTVTLSGAIAAGADTTLAITGNGTAIFAGTASSFAGSFDVQSGTLAFTGAMSVDGAITVGAAGNLAIGGSLAFNTPITSSGSVTLQTGANIALNLNDFTNGSYTLVSGGRIVSDNAAIASIITVDGIRLADMGSSQYTINTDGGLVITLSDNLFWAGTETQHTWSDTRFGPRVNAPGSSDTALFTDSATNKNVTIGSGISVHHAVFDSHETYRLTASGLETLAADKISQIGSGETHIDATVKATDVVVEHGTLSLGRAAEISGTLTAANNTRLSMAYADIHSLSLGQNVTIGSTYEGLAYTLANNLSFVSGGTLNIDRVQLTVKHGSDRWLSDITQTINLTNGAVLDDRHAKYRLTGGTLNIDGGGTLYIKGFRLNDSGQKTTTLNVKNDSTLIITGSNAGIDGDFGLSHWRDQSYLNIGGTVTSNAIISTWDSTSTITVQEGGTLNLLKGLSRNNDHSSDGTPRHNTITLTVASGARLNAAGGTQELYLAPTLQAGSTLGAIGEDVTFTNNFTLSGNGTATIDTNYSTADADFIVTRGTEGGTVTLSGAITAGADTTLAITGNGTVKFTGNNSSSFDGALDVQSGATLAITDSGKSIISAAGSVTIGSGATFDLSSATFNDGNSHAISLSAEHTFTFSEGSTLNLGDLDSGTYQVFNTESGGALVNWDSLTKENLTLAGEVVPASAGITFNTNGSVTISLQKQDLVWNNSANNTVWDYAEESWLHGNQSTSFNYRDSVLFDSNASSSEVTVASNILVANVTFEEGADVTLHQQDAHTLTADTLTINGTLRTDFGLSVHDSVSGLGKWVLLEGARQGLARNQLGNIAAIEVQKGATLVMSDTGMNGFTWNNATALEGQGEVEVSLSGQFGNTINVGTGFAGTTYVKSGNFTINNVVVGTALRMADGTNMRLSGATAFNGNLILDGTTQVHQNNSANFTINGSLTGSGTYDRRGGGTLTVIGETNLAHFKNDTPDNATSVFRGKTTLGSLLISKSSVRVTFENNATITKGISVSTVNTGNNTVQFNGDKSSVTGDVTISGANNTIQFAGTTISANGTASIREATVEATKAQGEGGLSLLKFKGEADSFATLEGALIHLAESTRLELENVAIGAGSSITGAGNGNSTVVFNHATVTLPYNAAAPAVLNDIAPLAATEGDVGEGMTLTQTGTTDRTCFIPAGTNCYAIAASNLADTELTGSSLTFDVSGYAEALKGYDLFSIVFADGVTISNPSALSITATTGTETFAGFYNPQAGGAPVVYFGKATEVVPEPTTTAFGLLALAALAARRRRRG